jgi:hypothetical protein
MTGWEVGIDIRRTRHLSLHTPCADWSEREREGERDSSMEMCGEVVGMMYI